jgi:hypothetical protein
VRPTLSKGMPFFARPACGGAEPAIPERPGRARGHFDLHDRDGLVRQSHSSDVTAVPPAMLRAISLRFPGRRKGCGNADIARLLQRLRVGPTAQSDGRRLSVAVDAARLRFRQGRSLMRFGMPTAVLIAHRI